MTAIFVSVKPEETRMGLVFDSKLRDFAVERRGEGNLVGNIYRGRVSNVVPGIQAAFIDLNVGKNGFLTLHKQDRLTEGRCFLSRLSRTVGEPKGRVSRET